MQLVVIVVCFFVFCESKNFGPTITAPKRFDAGDFMTSNNSQYHAIMQQDGNFVIYCGSLADKPSSARWRTQTNQHSNGPYHMDLQDDNNLILYDSYQQPLWQARKILKMDGDPPARLNLMDDGNLVLQDSKGKKLWWSKADLKNLIVSTKAPKHTRKPNNNGWGDQGK